MLNPERFTKIQRKLGLPQLPEHHHILAKNRRIQPRPSAIFPQTTIGNDDVVVLLDLIIAVGGLIEYRRRELGKLFLASTTAPARERDIRFKPSQYIGQRLACRRIHGALRVVIAKNIENRIVFLPRETNIHRRDRFLHRIGNWLPVLRAFFAAKGTFGGLHFRGSEQSARSGMQIIEYAGEIFPRDVLRQQE